VLFLANGGNYRMRPPARQGRRTKIENANEIKVVGLVALRPNQPASSGRPKSDERELQPVPARRSARRDGSQREPFHLLMRLPWPARRPAKMRLPPAKDPKKVGPTAFHR